jgi:hypothetical protein
MRYIVEPRDYDSKEPMFPNQKLFHLRDFNTGRLSMGCYTNYSIAENICKIKNKKE